MTDPTERELQIRLIGMGFNKDDNEHEVLDRLEAIGKVLERRSSVLSTETQRSYNLGWNTLHQIIKSILEGNHD